MRLPCSHVLGTELGSACSRGTIARRMDDPFSFLTAGVRFNKQRFSKEISTFHAKGSSQKQLEQELQQQRLQQPGLPSSSSSHQTSSKKRKAANQGRPQSGEGAHACVCVCVCVFACAHACKCICAPWKIRCLIKLLEGLSIHLSFSPPQHASALFIA